MSSSQQPDPKTGALDCGPGTVRSAGAQEEPSYLKQLRCQVMFWLLISIAALGFVKRSPKLQSL